MKKILFVVVILIVSQISLAQDETITAISDVMAKPSSDIYFITRNRIQRFVNDLSNHGNRAQTVLKDLSAVTTAARADFGLKTSNITAGIWTAIQNILTSLVETTSVIPQAVWACVENEVDRAGQIVNNTINDGFACVSNSVNGVLTLLSTGAETAGSAITLSTNIATEVVTCGISTITNFLQVGLCLNKIIQKYQAQVNTLIGQIIALIATAASNIISVPIGVGICASSTAAAAALESASLVSDVVACGADTIGQIIGQGK